MATSSPSQPKSARSKNGKSNGSGARAVTTDQPSVEKKATSSAQIGAAPTTEDIARRAYEIYEREGRQPGNELQNWLKAEAELGADKSH
ncbi:MAG TPA: DUF2934 domain-containing protein [Polyangia bacterium]|nr:DUF2934 domain-containing protein [Polyangia bacterium]